MKLWFCLFICLLLTHGANPISAYSQPSHTITPDVRCQICGMFVAKYPNWVTQIVLDNNTVHYFDGVKDLMVFALNSSHYGVEKKAISEVWVKDYYSLEWIDGRQCFYVVGSDVYGPMGHEFIPFATKEAAVNFLKDHKGKEIITFGGITMQRVEAMRVGQKMR